MALDLPFAAIRTFDQWRRCAHAGTTIDRGAGWVELASAPPPRAPEATGAAPPAVGLAFDGACRLYRVLEDGADGSGRLEVRLWRASPGAAGETAPALDASVTGGLLRARGLAVVGDHLFVAEAGRRRVLVFDLEARRLSRIVRLAQQPVDLAARGDVVLVLLAEAPFLLRLGRFADPRREPLDPQVTLAPAGPSRLAASAGATFTLCDPGTAGARLVRLDRAAPAQPVPFASDIELERDDVVVVARRPGEAFLRFALDGAALRTAPPLHARRYDGRGIVRTPDGRIGYFTDRGFSHAVAARVVYEREGRLVSFRLDAGTYQTTWGRLFLDACIPAGTSLHVHALSSDEPPDEAPFAQGLDLRDGAPHAQLSAPLPPAALVPEPAAITGEVFRRSGRELPWSEAPARDPFATYEAALAVRPGRYLWVTLKLAGNTRATPRVRALRAEYPGHTHLDRLPRVFSRDERAASFLHRYLTPLAGALADLERRAACREALLDPHGTPDELVPWLASFVGLVLDERWAPQARRRALAEATWLFRFRGTVPGVRRFVELYLGVPVLVLEHYRLRGLGTDLVGDAATGPAVTGVLGAGFRVGARYGEVDQQLLEGTDDDAFRRHAHRYTVIVPGALAAAQAQVVRDILRVHGPAHTIFDVCTVGAGMRVGRGLHVGLTSILGGGDDWLRLQMGGSVLGRDALLGRPLPGARVGDPLDGTARVG